ncbi:MAG: LysR family transcriptional regulator [Desulfitobacteriaceae bacterium]
MLLHQLEVFLQVAEKNSFTKAAEALFLSQSTVSAQYKQFRKELCRLWPRHSSTSVWN